MYGGNVPNRLISIAATMQTTTTKIAKGREFIPAFIPNS